MQKKDCMIAVPSGSLLYSAFGQDGHRKWNDRLNGPVRPIQPIIPFPVPILSERTVVVAMLCHAFLSEI